MKLFNLGSKSEQKEEYLFCLVLRQEDGIGVLMHAGPSSEPIEITEKRLFHFSNGWENIVYDVDELLFAMENEHNIKIKKVSYFMYGHFIDPHTKELKETYAQHLKNISKENGLESIGYFEYNELIPAYLEQKEGNKLSAMLIDVFNKILCLSNTFRKNNF